MICVARLPGLDETSSVRVTDEQMIAATAGLQHGSFSVVDVRPDEGQSMRLRFLIPGESELCRTMKRLKTVIM